MSGSATASSAGSGASPASTMQAGQQSPGNEVTRLPPQLRQCNGGSCSVSGGGDAGVAAMLAAGSLPAQRGQSSPGVPHARTHPHEMQMRGWPSGVDRMGELVASHFDNARRPGAARRFFDGNGPTRDTRLHDLQPRRSRCLRRSRQSGSQCCDFFFDVVLGLHGFSHFAVK